MSNVATYESGGLSPQQTRELVNRAKDGDRSALSDLIAGHQDFAFRTAMRYTAGNEEAALELAQEAMVNVFRKIHMFRGDSRFTTWLYRIVSNLARNRYVRVNRDVKRYYSLDAPRRNREEDDRPRELPDEHHTPRDSAAWAEALEKVNAAVEGLEPDFREVMVLRFTECMSYEQISEVMEIPVGTVKSRINRARKMIREVAGDILAELE